MVSKPYVCENDETTKAGDDEVEERAWVLGLRRTKVSLRLPKTLVSLMLPITGVSLLLLRYSGQPLANRNWGQPLLTVNPFYRPELSGE